MALKRKSKSSEDGGDTDELDVPNEWSAATMASRIDGPLIPTGMQSVDAPPQPSYLGPLLVTVMCVIPIGFVLARSIPDLVLVAGIALALSLPLGLVSMLYAIQVPVRWRRGDQNGSRHCAERAEFWMYATVGAQIMLGIAAFLYWLLYYRHQSPYT